MSYCPECAKLERDLAAASADIKQVMADNLDLAKINADLLERESAARAEADGKDAILRQLAKDGRLWVDVEDPQGARVRLVYQPEHESDIVKARAESAHLRELLGLFMLECGFLHHAKADRHMSTEPCPVEARIRAALEAER